jgi:outer membrane protein assembly factor BamD
LDQTSTKAAIVDMQMFINIYPNSVKVEEANQVMDELQEKLRNKDFEIAKLYHHTEYYKSAIYALNQHLKDYPSSPYREEAMYMIIKSNYDYAEKSVSNKQRERYTDAILAYNDYIDKFPEGEHSKNAKKYFVAAQEKIKLIENSSTKRNKKLI